MTALNAIPVLDGSPRRARTLSRFAVTPHPATFWVAMWSALAITEFVALMPVILGSAEPQPAWMVLYRAVGGSFAACGLVAWRRRPDSRVGMLMTATGFGLFVWPVLGQVDSPTVLILADLFEDAWGIPIITLLLAYLTGGRLRTSGERLLVGAFVLELVLEFAVHAFYELPGNFLLLTANEDLALALNTARQWLVSGACLAVALVVFTRWRAASGPRRRAMLPSVAGIVCLLLFALLQLVRSELVLWLAVSSLFVVPAAFLAGLLRSRLARGGLADLLHDVRGMHGLELEPALARTLGDPSLRIAYPVAGAPAIEPGPGVLVLESDGRALAALLYDPSLDEDPELVSAVGAAAAIALENEDRVKELQDSRERIVTAGDDERRRLERNLHDGAQQRLVGIALQLRMLRNRVGDDPAAVALIAAVSEELAHSLAELRELARGIHPSVLDHGLGGALESLIARCPVPTRLEVEAGPSLSGPVELAAYFVVSEALTNVAKYAQASTVSVTVTRPSGRLMIRIADDGVGGASADGGSGLRGLADRVGALGGCLRVLSPPGRGTVVIAELAV